MCLTQLSDVSALPTEFLIFRAGENPSTKGSVWFDDVAAQRVMAAAKKWGNDYAIDLEHHSVLSPAARPDAPDARGYFRLEMRAGDLWAVGVTWTDDGAERLKSRKQRYTSPAFDQVFDATLCGGRGGHRVVELMNVGLVAQPATDHLQALVASKYLLDRRSATEYGAGMGTTEMIQQALDLLKSGDVAGAQAALEQCLAASAPPAVEAKADAPPAPAPAEQPPPAEPEEYAAMRTELSAFRAAQATADATERRSLITALVEVGAETPVTAWSNNAPVGRLAAEPLAELRSRVAVLRSARKGAIVPPTGVGEFEGLTEAEQNHASKIEDVKLRAKFIAVRKSRKTA
jgi:phage I-like protein